ncbi:hypothetical protein U9M48_025695 [Paspalum notatum var. saurae]|uniref:Calmodulin-binding domain-containing protein n=1 Tax=Paspalum notatum var. saurae TaxID=547442 RepID=A0AAQ3TPB3_PASNO
MQIISSCDPHLHLCNMREVKLEIPNRKQAMEQSRCLLPRSSSEIADPPSPFSSNPAHHPVSVPATPGLTSSSSFARMFAAATADTPPITPKGGKPNKPTPAAAAAAYYASLWSPRRLMQRAARAFRTSRSRRVKAKDVPGGEERASVPTSGGKVYDAAAAAGNDGHGGVAATLLEQQRHHHRHESHPDSVPAEKIIHVANHHHHAPPPPPVVLTGEDECGKTTTPPPAAEEKDATPAPAPAPAEEEAVESPKKAGAPAAEDVADKFVTVVKEAIKKHEAEQQHQQQDEKKEAMRRFQGSRVKTAMEARPESEQPRRREAAPPSNDVIEEARSKLLEKRHSRVRALVGAFETVMDANKDAAAAAKPQHHYRKSV